MDFGANETPVELIKEEPFGGTYFINTYSSVIINGIKSHGKNLLN